MCWISYNIPISRTAEKDIPVFKIMNINKEGKLKSLYIGFKYEVGKFYAENIDDPKKIAGKWYELYRAFHSYSTECKVTSDRNYFIVNLCNSDHKAVPILKYDSTVNKMVKVNCIIPKGSIYYLSERGEYASNQIKIINYDVLEECKGNKTNS